MAEATPPAHPPHPPQSPHPPPSHRVADDSLAAALEPVLRETCGGRLSKLEWFRSTWQSSGASTGFGTYTTDDGVQHPVCVKLPVGPNEYRWTTGVCEHYTRTHPDAPDELPTLRVYAHGVELGGYDLAWLIVERLPGHTLTSDTSKTCIQDLLRATARWYALAAQLRPVGDPPAPPDWEAQLHKAREALKNSDIEEPQRWNYVLKNVHKILDRLAQRWAARPINTWCHGDLHPGNVMRRQPTHPAPGAPSASISPGGNGATGAEHGAPCVLMDLAFVHAGHWVEDAVYLERLHWHRPEALHGVKPVQTLAKLRKEFGLAHADHASGDHEDHGTLANIRRVLMAATTPAFLHREGNPKYVRAALEKLETLLPLVAK